MARKQMIKLDLATWRTARPEQIRPLLNDLVAVLVPLTAPLVAGNERGEYLLGIAATVRGNRGVSTAVLLAEALDVDGNNQDLAYSWYAVGGAMSHGVDFGDSLARMIVAMQLTQMATNLESKAKWDDLFDPHEAKKMRLLASAWIASGILQPQIGMPGRKLFARMGCVGNLVEASYAKMEAKAGLSGLAKVEACRSDEDILDKALSKGKQLFMAEVAKEEAELAALAKIADGPHLVVCKAITPSGRAKSDGSLGADDAAMLATWKCLTEPLPLAAGPSPDLLESVLLGEFPWLAEAIQAITGDLRLRRAAGLGHAHWRPLLLVGPPGTGKTRLARRVADLVGTGFGEVCAAGSSDNRALQGTARAWSSATPSLVLHVMRQSQTANPVMLVDELDKSNGGKNGDIKQTLLGMLEPVSAKNWPDECLISPCNLSQVSWIATANDATPLRGPLLTRLRVVECPMPRTEHFSCLLAGIQRDLAADLGVDSLPELHPEVEAALRAGFERGVSVRRVKQAVEGALAAGRGLEHQIVRH